MVGWLVGWLVGVVDWLVVEFLVVLYALLSGGVGGTPYIHLLTLMTLELNGRGFVWRVWEFKGRQTPPYMPLNKER